MKKPIRATAIRKLSEEAPRDGHSHSYIYLVHTPICQACSTRSWMPSTAVSPCQELGCREHPLNSVLSACPLIFLFLPSFSSLCVNHAPSSKSHRFQVTDTQLSLHHHDVLIRHSFQPHPRFPRPLFHFCSRRA